jgi:hypothetical protein
MNQMWSFRRVIAVYLVACCIYLLGILEWALCAETESASVCSVASTPEHFDGQQVSIHALYFNDGFKWQGLVDVSCINVGIVVSIPQSAKGREALNAVLSKGRLGSLDKTITATFVGVFSWLPNGSPNRVMLVSEISDLNVEPGPNPFLVIQGLAGMGDTPNAQAVSLEVESKAILCLFPNGDRLLKSIGGAHDWLGHYRFKIAGVPNSSAEGMTLPQIAGAFYSPDGRFALFNEALISGNFILMFERPFLLRRRGNGWEVIDGPDGMVKGLSGIGDRQEAKTILGSMDSLPFKSASIGPRAPYCIAPGDWKARGSKYFPGQR